MKSILLTIGAIGLLAGCSTNSDKSLDVTSTQLSGGYMTAQIINQQHSASHLPSWLKAGESGCEATSDTYCAIECVVVDGDDHFLDQRYASNLAKAKVLGYLKTAMRLYDESMQARRGEIQSREAGNYVDSVVQGYAYGIRTPETAYRNTLERLEVCSLAVFNPQQASNLISEYARISGLQFDAKTLQAEKKKLLSEEFRDRAKKRFSEDQSSEASNG